jgi:hypothetical protein
MRENIKMSYVPHLLHLSSKSQSFEENSCVDKAPLNPQDAIMFKNPGTPGIVSAKVFSTDPLKEPMIRLRNQLALPYDHVKICLEGQNIASS